MSELPTTYRPDLPSLVVTSTSGLCNRIRMLLSGLAVAERTHRRFAMPWMRTRHCAAAYHQLFANDWPVHEAEAEDIVELPWMKPAQIRAALLADPSSVPEVRINWVSWLHHTLPDGPRAVIEARVVELFRELRPTMPIEARVEGIKSASFRPTMIGVHLRRGDMLRARPDVTANTDAAVAAVDALLDVHPDAGLLLCTDDGAVDQVTGGLHREGVEDRFRARYGSRVVTTGPSSLDRRQAGAIKDALVDLWLLRSTDMIVGSTASSFSQLAAFGRDVPLQLCGAPEPHAAMLIGRIDRFGVRPLLRLAGEKGGNPWTEWTQAQRLPRRLVAAAANFLVPGRRRRRGLAALRRLQVETKDVDP